MKFKLTQRNIIIGAMFLFIIILLQPFTIPFFGGWEVRTSAVRANVDGLPWVKTDPAQWKHDFDLPYSGAPDLIIDAGKDPVHTNAYFYPSPIDQPIKTITKKTATREYQYDLHIYTQDITLRTDGDKKVNDDPGSNSIESESSYSHDRAGDNGAHDFTVQFLFETQPWERFTDELKSWAGIMSIYTYRDPTVGVQSYTIQDLDFPKDLSPDFRAATTEVTHNPRPGTQGSKLNMFTETGQLQPALTPESVAPSASIPAKVLFELACEFRAGALVGEDSWGNEENIYVLDPFCIFHVAFEVLTVHEFYLETSPISITQRTPVPSGSPGTFEYEGPWYEQLGQFLDNLWPFGGLQGLLMFVILAVVVIAVAPTALSIVFGRRMLR